MQGTIDAKIGLTELVLFEMLAASSSAHRFAVRWLIINTLQVL